ncbi:MAG: hypothetical protein HON37_02930 [Candidatus Marinimicrobia bacterium]|nr:hypothetical protein [Candidatus Neomarinimicrobiota bacterium]MBT3682992.1 hypothetical protein [Candidatus Neomarinimicrobiota bacterium]MBT4172899.1 hypothetical protein [Candidatus Neomarinimicrobiota bacterium]MBT4537537.1 hypothetical protein [Candidatus Neomarinimicrobiota bacterium]MBT4851007.1 hypothetical protein [Candidatus Neomarinimicrobiota bacterium]
MDQSLPKNSRHVYAIIAMLLFTCLLFSSTTFIGVKGKNVYAASNENSVDANAYLKFVPADGNGYGVIYFCNNDEEPVGGVNTEGLFANITRCPRKQIKPNSEKETLWGNLLENILESCADVDDVIALADKYNLYDLHEAQIMVGDKSGAAAILEGEDIVHRKENYLLMTNFYHTNPDLEDLPLERYKIAEKMLENNKIDIDNFRRILAATKRELTSPTIFSYILDLRKSQVYLYNFHGFENEMVLNVDDALSKGLRKVNIDELFELNTPTKSEYIVFNRKRGIDNDLRSFRGVLAAEKIWEWFQEDSDFNIYREGELNMQGYTYMNAQAFQSAVAIFELNTRMFPNSGNVWDSLGEGYMNSGETELAIINYEKSLEIDPGNTNAVTMLKRLREEPNND